MFQGGGAKLRFQEIRKGESGIQLFSVIYTSDIRLDEFPRGGERYEKKARGRMTPAPLNAPLLTIISIVPMCISLMSVCQRANHE